MHIRVSHVLLGANVVHRVLTYTSVREGNGISQGLAGTREAGMGRGTGRGLARAHSERAGG